jgi:hypothetical protein
MCQAREGAALRRCDYAVGSTWAIHSLGTAGGCAEGSRRVHRPLNPILNFVLGDVRLIRSTQIEHGTEKIINTPYSHGQMGRGTQAWYGAGLLSLWVKALVGSNPTPGAIISEIGE